MLTSRSSVTNFTITRNPGDENLLFQKPWLEACFKKSKDRLVIVSSAIKMSVSNFMFLVFMSHQLVLNGNVFSLKYVCYFFVFFLTLYLFFQDLLFQLGIIHLAKVCNPYIVVNIMFFLTPSIVDFNKAWFLLVLKLIPFGFQMTPCVFFVWTNKIKHGQW